MCFLWYVLFCGTTVSYPEPLRSHVTSHELLLSSWTIPFPLRHGFEFHPSWVASVELLRPSEARIYILFFFLCPNLFVCLASLINLPTIPWPVGMEGNKTSHTPAVSSETFALACRLSAWCLLCVLPFSSRQL